MSILFPQDKSWNVSNWISLGFFEDCIPYLEKVEQLKDDIQLCIRANIDTLDLREKDIKSIIELKTLVKNVIEDNHIKKGSNFHSVEYFPIYLEKLKELDLLIDEFLNTTDTCRPPVLNNVSQADSTFTFEAYKQMIEKYDLLTTRRNRFIFKDEDIPTTLNQQIFYKLPAEYRSKLPNYLLAYCPICRGKVKEPIDIYSLNGLGWHFNSPDGFGWFGRQPKNAGGVGRLSAFPRLPEPSYQADCEHVKAVMYGVNFNGILPDDVNRWHVETGAERPGVLKPFISQKDCYVVIHSLPVGRFDDEVWQPRYTVYFATYFSQDNSAYLKSLAPQKLDNQDFYWPYDKMDYDLIPWVKAGKLFWLDPQNPDLPLQGKSIDEFPYGHIEGLEGRWRIANRQLELLPLDLVGWHLPERLSRNKQRLALQEEALQKRALQKLKRD